MNKVIIMGNLGQDPETRYLPLGTAVTNISVATSRSWKDKESGEKRDETSWHRCVAFGRTAEVIGEHFSKGRKILIEGRLQYGKYDDKEGITRYTTDIMIERFEFVESRGDGQQQQPRQQQMSPQQSASQGTPNKASDEPEPEWDDSIPF